MQCKVPPLSCHDHCYLTKGPLIYFGSWTRSWHCTVWHCFSVGIGNLILINTGEVHLYHCCVGICCCCSQSACFICVCLQLVNKGRVGNKFSKVPFFSFFSVWPSSSFSQWYHVAATLKMFLVDFIQIGCLEFNLAKYTVQVMHFLLVVLQAHNLINSSP